MLLFLLACTPAERFDDPIPASDPWERAEPDADTLARLEAARDYSAEHGGFSLMVLEGDLVVFEDYFNGHSNETPWPFYSGTKTISCMAAMLAQEQGHFAITDLASETITEWQDVEHKEEITIEQLLRFTSGLKDDWWVLSHEGRKAVEDQKVADKYAHAIEQPSEYAPGERWVYGSVHLTAFGALLERVLDESPLSWLDHEVFEPIDFRYSGWNHDPDGNPMLAYGVWTSTPELAKLGALMRDDGEWLGERVLPAGTLSACMEPTEVNPAYGLAAWLNEPLGETAEFDGLNEEGDVMLDGGPEMLAFGGARAQRVYVIPELSWVVVAQGDEPRDWVDSEFLALLLE